MPLSILVDVQPIYVLVDRIGSNTYIGWFSTNTHIGWSSTYIGWTSILVLTHIHNRPIAYFSRKHENIAYRARTLIKMVERVQGHILSSETLSDMSCLRIDIWPPCVQTSTPNRRIWHWHYLYPWYRLTVADIIVSRLHNNPTPTCHADDKDISKETKWKNFLVLINHYN